MPFLNAKALETDPDGMAFLRSVIRPGFEQEEAASPPVSRDSLMQRFQAARLAPPEAWPVESDSDSAPVESLAVG